MTAAILPLSKGCCGLVKKGPTADFRGKVNQSGKVMLVLTVFDAFVGLTSLVLGILGVLYLTPGMPPAAAYALLGVSGAILALWLTLGILTKGEIFKAVMTLTSALCSCTKKPFSFTESSRLVL